MQAATENPDVLLKQERYEEPSYQPLHTERAMTEPPPKTYGHARSVRLKGQDYSAPGLAFSLTWCVQDRAQAFVEPQKARAACGVLRQAPAKSGHKLWAACVMPDHIHVLLENTEGCKPAGSFVAAAKVAISWNVVEVAWQKSFYDHILRPDEDPRDAARYIANNPVRAGLSGDWRDWPGSWIADHAL